MLIVNDVLPIFPFADWDARRYQDSWMVGTFGPSFYDGDPVITMKLTQECPRRTDWQRYTKLRTLVERLVRDGYYSKTPFLRIPDPFDVLGVDGLQIFRLQAKTPVQPEMEPMHAHTFPVLVDERPSCQALVACNLPKMDGSSFCVYHDAIIQSLDQEFLGYTSAEMSEKAR